VGRDERRRKLDRGPVTLLRGLFCCWRGPDITSERGYCVGGDGIEQRLDQELSFSDAARRSETIEGWNVFFGVVPFFWIIRRVFNGLQLAKEPSAVEAGVGEEPCNLSKNFSFLKGGSLVVLLSPRVFQFNRELGGGRFEEVLRAQNVKHTCNVALVLLSRNKCRRVTGPTSTYSARLR